MAAQNSFTTLWNVAGAAAGLGAGWVLSFVAVLPERIRPVLLARAWLARLSRMRKVAVVPPRQSAFRTMLKVLGTAAGLGGGSSLYALWLFGTSSDGVLVAMGTIILVSALAVFGGVVMYLE